MVLSSRLVALALSGAVVSAFPAAPERAGGFYDIECRGLGARCAKKQHKHASSSFAPSGGFAFPTGTAPIPKGTGYASSSVAVAAVAAVSTTSSASASLSTGTTSSSNSTGSASGTSSCTATTDCTFTDASAAMSGAASCTCLYLSNIEVPAETTLDLTTVADGTTIVFDGTTTFAYGEWEGPMISVAGTSITVTGSTGHEINAGGEQYWDGEGSNGGKTKPKFFAAHKMIDSTISGLNILNTPVQGFSINDAQNLAVDSVTIDNSAGDGDDGGHNTDAFDVGSSTGVYITNANIKNQDDCLAINSGTDISFTGGTCSGGHGLSIGSVGGRDDNDVANIYIADSTVSASANGVRIKTVSGATGSVKNVTYSNIQLSGITDYGIVIEQDYENGSPTGTPTDGVPITDLTVDTVTGTVESDADNIYILCASCSDWTWTGVSVTGGATDSDCTGIPTGASC